MALDDDLYARGASTLLASWDAYAQGSHSASVERLSGVAAAVFPKGPERLVYNNALLERGLDPGGRAAALDAMEGTYRSRGVDRYAVWAHASDEAMLSELQSRGYRVEETTRAMGVWLDRLDPPPSSVAFEAPGWSEYLSYLEGIGAPAGLLRGADPGAFHLLAVKEGGDYVATALAFDHDGDCGIYNMSTVPSARRRGLGTALTARHLHDAARRGCSSASLQSTPIAERVYAAVGFRDLGRFVEHVPSSLASDNG